MSLLELEHRGVVHLLTLGGTQVLTHAVTGEVKSLQDGPYVLTFTEDGMGVLTPAGSDEIIWVSTRLSMKCFRSAREGAG